MEDKLEENHYADEIYSISQKLNCTSGRLFLGGKEAAADLEFLHQNSIKAVLTLASTADVQYEACEAISHKMIDADDTSTYQICEHFVPCWEFIETHINTCNVLVHCEKGISRSATIVIAYLMQREKKLLSEAIEFVRNKRKEISPNGGFYFQLSKFQDTLKITENRQRMLAQQQHQQIPNQSQAPIRFFRSRPMNQPIENNNNNEVNPLPSV